MKRRLANLLVALSLLQCVALGHFVGGPGVRGYTLWDTRYSRWSLVSSPVTVWVEQRTVIASWPVTYTRIVDRRLWGFGYDEWRYDSNLWHDGTYRPMRFRSCFAPVIAVLPISLTIFGWGLVRIGRGLIRADRRSNGRCAECGYDLRATPARCPECGATPPLKAVATAKLHH